MVCASMVGKERVIYLLEMVTKEHNKGCKCKVEPIFLHGENSCSKENCEKENFGN
jgi:hypothetical protein